MATLSKILTQQFTPGLEGGGDDLVFWENDQTITYSYTLKENKNALTVGPVEINDGVTITVPDGSRWVVI
jgi:hypothetical protein